MHKLPQGVPAQGTTHPPCPKWCEEHWDSDEDVRKGVVTSIYRHHSSEHRMPYQCVSGPPEHRHEVHEAVVSVLRYDSDHAVGETQIVIGGISPDQDALSVDDTERLALILHQAVLTARTERPERNTNEINPFDRASTRGNVSVADTGSTPTAPPA